jgi:hypothetical protein
MILAGFAFPATTVSVLAVSTHEDQAVMTSTLGLWRNLGTVMGVAVSSLIVQNALKAYLEEYITGPDKYSVSIYSPSYFPGLWSDVLIHCSSLNKCENLSLQYATSMLCIKPKVPSFRHCVYL